MSTQKKSYKEQYEAVTEQVKQMQKKKRELNRKMIKEEKQQKAEKHLSDLHKLLEWCKKNSIVTSHRDGSQENRTLYEWFKSEVQDVDI